MKNPRIHLGPFSSTFARLAAGLGAAALLVACGDVRVREFNAARWIVPESSFVYVQHDFVITGEGGSIGRPESNGYPESGIQVFRQDIGPRAWKPRTKLFALDRVVPCGELVYRASDSLLFLSYLELDETNGMKRYGCGESPRLIALGKLAGKTWVPRNTPEGDTLRALVEALRDSKIDAQGEGSLVIDSAYERLCARGHCILSGQKL